jgi:alkanesulfonate monooxygenase SsuD/methylene tetrahydromethanopterin reductase-like flavin-dependent oxidoreductase (luciferase family)
VMVRLPGGTGRIQGSYTAEGPPPPIAGSAAQIADGLRGFADEGIEHVQLVLDPITLDSIRTVAGALTELDRA